MTEERGVTKRFAKVCPCEACKKTRGERHKVFAGTIHNYTSQPSMGWKPMMTLAEKREVAAGGPKPFFMGVELETVVKQPPSGLYDPIPYHETMRIDRANPWPVHPQPANDQYGRPNYDHPDYLAYEVEYSAVDRRRRQAVDQYRRTRAARAAAGVSYATADEAVSMARPRPFWHPKHDGSVSGPEFASLPASMAWWYSRRAQFEFMFTNLLHAGVRSHSGDAAGLHVNISMTAFEDSAHLARFASLINLNKGWSRKMSQRTLHSESHWSNIGQYPFANTSTIESWAVRTMQRGNGGGDRYNALNTPGLGRIEFRLPRGTLRIDRFYKNLEWVHSMIEFTRQFGQTSSAVYMRWVMGLDQYPDLQAYLTEKFGVEKGEPFTPAIPAPVTLIPITAPAAVLYEYDFRNPRNNECPCGDGCELGDCGSCDEPEEEESSDYTPCPCDDGCQINDCGNCEHIDYVYSPRAGRWLTDEEQATEREEIERDRLHRAAELRRLFPVFEEPVAGGVPEPVVVNTTWGEWSRIGVVDVGMTPDDFVPPTGDALTNEVRTRLQEAQQLAWSTYSNAGTPAESE